eukprot:GHVT01035274.1.p1 GENE.GHVT01035274.1~~GHVT01035274.1.p1  ORF type:complete len:623 (-),score=92.77 GHVT01035274.1:1184-3052(-)
MGGWRWYRARAKATASGRECRPQRAERVRGRVRSNEAVVLCVLREFEVALTNALVREAIRFDLTFRADNRSWAFERTQRILGEESSGTPAQTAEGAANEADGDRDTEKNKGDSGRMTTEKNKGDTGRMTSEARVRREAAPIPSRISRGAHVGGRILPWPTSCRVEIIAFSNIDNRLLTVPTSFGFLSWLCAGLDVDTRWSHFDDSERRRDSNRTAGRDGGFSLSPQEVPGSPAALFSPTAPMTCRQRESSVEPADTASQRSIDLEIESCKTPAESRPLVTSGAWQRLFSAAFVGQAFASLHDTDDGADLRTPSTLLGGRATTNSRASTTARPSDGQASTRGTNGVRMPRLLQRAFQGASLAGQHYTAIAHLLLHCLTTTCPAPDVLAALSPAVHATIVLQFLLTVVMPAVEEPEEMEGGFEIDNARRCREQLLVALHVMVGEDVAAAAAAHMWTLASLMLLPDDHHAPPSLPGPAMLLGGAELPQCPLTHQAKPRLPGCGGFAGRMTNCEAQPVPSLPAEIVARLVLLLKAIVRDQLLRLNLHQLAAAAMQFSARLAMSPWGGDMRTLAPPTLSYDEPSTGKGNWPKQPQATEQLHRRRATVATGNAIGSNYTGSHATGAGR